MAKAKDTQAPSAKNLAKTALVALTDLEAFAAEHEAPEDVIKAARRIRKRMESAFGKIVLWEELL
jgi:hypothetical protein